MYISTGAIFAGLLVWGLFAILGTDGVFIFLGIIIAGIAAMAGIFFLVYIVLSLFVTEPVTWELVLGTIFFAAYVFMIAGAIYYNVVKPFLPKTEAEKHNEYIENILKKADEDRERKEREEAGRRREEASRRLALAHPWIAAVLKPVASILKVIYLGFIYAFGIGILTLMGYIVWQLWLHAPYLLYMSLIFVLFGVLSAAGEAYSTYRSEKISK